MELRNVETFLTVVENNSFSKAADVLGYTQSTVTFHIKQLEDDVGWPLIQMYGGRVFLTRTGAMFLNRAQNLVDFYFKRVVCCMAGGDRKRQRRSE